MQTSVRHFRVVASLITAWLVATIIVLGWQTWILAGGFAAALVASGIAILLLVIRLGQRQEALIASEARFRELAELSADWYWEQDDQFRFTYRSKDFHDGAIAPGDVLGKRRWEIEGIEPDPALWGAHKAALEAHQPFHAFEFWLRRPDGQRICISTSGRPIFSGHGVFVGYCGVASNVTLHKHAEEALRASEERYRDLIENSHDLICTHDLDGKLLSVNEAAFRLTGYPREALVGTRIADFLAPALRDSFAAYLTEIRTAGVAQGIMRIRTAGGETRFLEYHNSLRTGAVPMVRGMAQDITERMQAEKALRESEEKYRNIYENIQDVYVETTIEGTIIEISPQIEVVSKGQYRREDLIGQSSVLFYADPDRRTDFLSALKTQGSVMDFETELLNRDGSRVACSVSARLIVDRQGPPQRLVATLRDVTKRKRAEAELRHSAHRLQDLSRRLVHVQETERQQIAGELHDSMGRDLTALAINLDLIRAQLPAQALADVEAKLDDSRALVGAAMQNVRSVVAGLRPALLEEWGLLPALRWHASEFSKRWAIPVAVAATGDEARLTDEVELALFRVAQEALLNCAKHTRATRIHISLEAIAGRTTLTVTDDGVGFIVDDIASGRMVPGLGLALMRERMEAVGGSLQVVSSPKAGTTITAVIKE